MRKGLGGIKRNTLDCTNNILNGGFFNAEISSLNLRSREVAMMLRFSMFSILFLICIVEFIHSFGRLCTTRLLAKRTAYHLHWHTFTSSASTTEDLYKDMKVAVLGGGAFSLALAKVLCFKNISSTLLVRNQSVADHINLYHNHPKYLTESLLPHHITATSDPQIALRDAQYVIHAVPMQQSRSFLTSIKAHLDPNVPILSATKGIEKGTLCLMNDILRETLGPERRTAYLSGPSFAQEIMDRKATAVVIASHDRELAQDIAVMLSSEEFRCHTCSDVKVGIVHI